MTTIPDGVAFAGPAVGEVVTRSTCNTCAASAAIRSSSSLTLPWAGSEVAIRANKADSRARRRERAANSLTTTAVTRNTASANQLRESASVSVYRGGRKKRRLTSLVSWWRIALLSSFLRPETEWVAAASF